jgi:hypothetical protein
LFKNWKKQLFYLLYFVFMKFSQLFSPARKTQHRFLKPVYSLFLLRLCERYILFSPAALEGTETPGGLISEGKIERSPPLF